MADVLIEMQSFFFKFTHLFSNGGRKMYVNFNAELGSFPEANENYQFSSRHQKLSQIRRLKRREKARSFNGNLNGLHISEQEPKVNIKLEIDNENKMSDDSASEDVNSKRKYNNSLTEPNDKLSTFSRWFCLFRPRIFCIKHAYFNYIVNN